MKKALIYIASAATLLSASCSSDLDTAPAGDKFSDEQLEELLKTDAELVLQSMMLGAVNYMHTGNRSGGTNDSGFMIWNLGMDMQGNDMVLCDLTNWFADEYMFENLRQQTASYTADRWYCYYKIVFQANQILDRILLIPEDAEGRALVYKAQALTYRALAYYYLMAVYQDDYLHGGKDKAGVPLYLTVEDAKGRTPSTEVFSTITEDLKTAVALFGAAGYDPKQSTSDIDQTVANMVLARVAVTTGDYATAAAAADAVITAGYSLMNEEQYTESGFQSTALPETVWGYTWADATSLGNRSFAAFMSVIGSSYGGVWGNACYVAIDSRLYDQIPATDYRKKCFQDADLEVAPGKVIPKYANRKFATQSFYQDEVYMRLAEAYLLKAEAEARGGNDAAAQQTLFDLVSKRDAAYAKSTKTGAGLLDEIFLQSRIELWGEGHEFFTNKRFNVGVDRSSSANHTHKAVKPAGKEFTYQIPLSIELNSNPHINAGDQNPL